MLSLQKHICGLLMTLKWMNQIDENEKHLSGIGKGKMNTHNTYKIQGPVFYIYCEIIVKSEVAYE